VSGLQLNSELRRLFALASQNSVAIYTKRLASGRVSDE